MKSPSRSHAWKQLALSLVLVIGATIAHADDALKQPPGLILTWQGDPTTSITIDWHRLAEESEAPSSIQMRPRGSGDWNSFSCQRLRFPHSDRWIDRVEIKGLKPATEYEFRGSPASRIYWFRTMPASLEKPLVIASGGDVRHRKIWMEETNRAVMARNPDFVIWGGDLAYADGEPKKIGNWYEFLDAMAGTLVTQDNRVPPVLVCIGNHEIRGGYHHGRIKGDKERADLAPFFYGLFAFPGQPGYGTLDFGNYLSLVFGDSEHSNPIPGAQTDWMRRTLAARKNITHVIPIYHVPAWPSAREFNNDISVLVREHWVPLFEQNGIRLALEHHDHTYKRTVPIFEGKENREKGIVYIGDGSWGVAPRKVHPAGETWYLEQSRSIRHALIITLHKDRKIIEAISPEGGALDSLTIPAR